MNDRQASPNDRLANDRLANDRLTNDRLTNDRLANDRQTTGKPPAKTGKKPGNHRKKRLGKDRGITKIETTAKY